MGVELRFFYGIKNLRSLDLPVTELRPITILVGRNNSGKSSLLRSFPLLKQSINDNVEGPISWYGKYADYGNYETAVKKDCGDEGITFNLRIENLPYVSYILNREKLMIGQKSLLNNRTFGNIGVNILIKRLNQRDVKRETEILLQNPKTHLSITSNVDGESEYIKLNNKDDLILDKNFSFKYSQDHIFSTIGPEYSGDYQDLSYDKFGLRNLLVLQVANLLREEFSNRKISIKQIEAEALKILENVSLNSKTLEKLKNNTSSELLKKFYQENSSDHSELISELTETCQLFWATTLHNLVCNIFRSIMTESIYFRPTRGHDSRYFRNQKLDTMEISPEGENLSGFYMSLNDEQINQFSDWMQENFGFGVTIEKVNDHISIHIREYSEEFNLADSGFGITEILPFLTQIWWEFYNPKKTANTSKLKGKKVFTINRFDFDLPKIVAIEQPELHLHPAHQAKMADVFVNAIKFSANSDFVKPNFVIETHSQSFINRLGELVRRKDISEDDINVLVFSKRYENSQVRVDIKESQYDSEGILQNWPYGFFRYSK